MPTPQEARRDTMEAAVKALEEVAAVDPAKQKLLDEMKAKLMPAPPKAPTPKPAAKPKPKKKGKK